ncbi:pentapeptide repeat-containing protein [Campylobacter sp. LH-2024]|uniref:pentapeptide repeat-containing protein n=1 Tax=Campylobacter sp. LH-2024 TaxID=3239825 RepID=UPI003B805FD2
MSVIKKLDGSIIIEDDNKSERELVKYCLENAISLNEANLDGLDLNHLNFDNVFINGASFKNTILSNISSKNASFVECDFTKSDFSFCNLLNTEFEECVLKELILRDTIGDMKNIFSVVLDTYVMTFTNEFMNLGCDSKSIEDWRKTTTDDIEDDEQKWLWDYYKELIFEIIDKRLGVKHD